MPDSKYFSHPSTPKHKGNFLRSSPEHLVGILEEKLVSDNVKAFPETGAPGDFISQASPCTDPNS